MFKEKSPALYLTGVILVLLTYVQFNTCKLNKLHISAQQSYIDLVPSLSFLSLFLLSLQPIYIPKC